MEWIENELPSKESIRSVVNDIWHIKNRVNATMLNQLITLTNELMRNENNNEIIVFIDNLLTADNLWKLRVETLFLKTKIFPMIWNCSI